MIFNQFSDNPILLIPFLLAIFYCFTIHEFAHALVALKQGDDTAERAGRLTLNPLAHIDLMGFLMFFFVGFGWAKPVPVNPSNFKNGKWSDNLVSLAGIFANLLSAGIFIIVFKLLIGFSNMEGSNLLLIFLSFLIQYNIMLAVFNLIPIPPLDGSHILMNVLPDRFSNFKDRLATQGPFVLLIFILADNFLNLGIFGALFQFVFSLVGKIF